MLEFAEFLTLHPSNINQSHTQELREFGWSDADIIDIVHITALFNYMDRVADGLGIELQADQGWDPLFAFNCGPGGKASPLPPSRRLG